MLQFVTPLVKIRDNSTKGLSLTSSSSLSSLSTSFIQPLHDIEHENNTTEKGKKKKGKKTKPSLGQAINDPLVRSFYSLQEYEKYRRDQEQVEKRGSEIILILSLSPLSTLLLLILPLHPPPPLSSFSLPVPPLLLSPSLPPLPFLSPSPHLPFPSLPPFSYPSGIIPNRRRHQYHLHHPTDIIILLPFTKKHPQEKPTSQILQRVRD